MLIQDPKTPRTYVTLMPPRGGRKREALCATAYGLKASDTFKALAEVVAAKGGQLIQRKRRKAS